MEWEGWKNINTRGAMRNSNNNMKGCNMRNEIATANTNMNAMPSYMYVPSVYLSSATFVFSACRSAILVRVDGSKCKNSGDSGAP